MFRDFIITTWVLTLVMLVNVININNDIDLHRPMHPDPGAFMILWVFIMSSFAIFAVGMFTLLTT